MRIFLAGGTGALGRRLIPRLVTAGHLVTATTRNRKSFTILEALGAEPAVMDGLDRDSVAHAVNAAEPEVVIHQMTALSGVPDMRRFDAWFAETNALRTQGTRHLLDAAVSAGVRRFIAQSYTGWPNAREGSPVKTEDDPLDPHPPKAQQRTLEAIAFVERAVTEAPMEGLVLRYGGFYGPGASEPLVEVVRRRRLPLVGDGAGIWCWLHVEDAAAATLAAVETGEPGLYNIVDDDPAPVADWLPYLAEAIGAPPPLHVPVWVARLLAGEAVVSMMTRIRGSSNAKARRELGWTPRWATWREGFRGGLEGK